MKNKIIEKVRIWFSLRGIALRKLIKEHYEDILEAQRIVEALKKGVGSPLVEAAVMLSPNVIDNRALFVTKKILEEVLKVLSLSEKCDSLLTYEEKEACFIQELKNMNQEAVKGIYLKVATWYLRKKLEKVKKVIVPLHTCDTMVQLVYEIK